VPFRLECDTCGFAREADAEVDAYAAARDHESNHPTHYVIIEKHE
jgi:hypothetical protein